MGNEEEVRRRVEWALKFGGGRYFYLPDDEREMYRQMKEQRRRRSLLERVKVYAVLSD